ncbi:MAG: IclR family transcriptional regulator [Nocardioides sp.]|uniref:IclR family transcriptional regulator n=1 Tax=Nocardioides sp. TaxID=35761 RepID=UPI0039E67F24
MSNDAAPGAGVQSVDRALTILEHLARAGEVGISDLARDLGVHKSTAFRLVATLEQHGLVEQTEDRGKYRLGGGLLRLAGATTARLDVVQEARPIVRRLAQATGETINIAVLADGSALYVDQASGSSSIQSHNWVGQRIPLHATSNGKVLLSGLDPRAALAAAGKLTGYTDGTVTSRDRLAAELVEVRAVGYSVAVDELEVGLTAIAVPLHNMHGDVIASMSVSGPTFRLDAAARDAALGLLRAAADEVSARLGYHSAAGATSA